MKSKIKSPADLRSHQAFFNGLVSLQPIENLHAKSEFYAFYQTEILIKDANE